MENMKMLKARVSKGRLVLNEPTDLPEGTEANLVFADEVFADDGDLSEMDPRERARLDQALEEGIAQAERGETISADESLRNLKRT